MKGAEVALVNGMRVKVGSAPECDIVIADTTLSEVAFELDVSDSGVTLVTADGETRPLTAFEIADSGTTAIAVGPADEPWRELVRPAPVESEPSESEPPESAEPASAEEPAVAAAEPETPSEEEPAHRRGRFFGVLSVLVTLFLLVILAWLFWRCRPAVRSVFDKVVEMCRGPVVTVESEASRIARVNLALAEIAKENALTLGERDGAPLLTGNLRRRTERLAIRALALAADPHVKFDLTDDETLRSSADALLFACTDGSLKSVAATNRRVTVTGYAPNAQALEKAIRALNADVKGIESLDTSSVVVGGLPPSAVAGSAFANDRGGVPASAATPVLKPRREYPIAGILTSPYPCVVMRDGLRLVAGAQIGSAVLVEIEADRLVLKEGDHVFEWRP